MKDQEKKSRKNAPSKESKGINRRDALKGLATIPVLGALAYNVVRKVRRDHRKKSDILTELGLESQGPAVQPQTTMKPSGDLIRIGVVGFGARGEQLSRSLGFAHPDWIESKRKGARQNRLDKSLQDWLTQENLNIAITGICDVFDLRAEKGLAAARCKEGPGGSTVFPSEARRYSRFEDMVQSPDIDVIVITTPDFHHAPMSILAVQAGKHVYCEKLMTRTESEAHRVYRTVKKSSVVFQVGHQYPQNAAYQKAREVIEKGILGKINLVETTTNRNSTWGSWVRHKDNNGKPFPGSEKTIDWKQWLGSRPRVPFSPERYYNWTLFWDYATGLSGQLLSHEYDAVNQILGLGIPHSCSASGGIYFHKDNREIPDIFNVVYEFPKKDLTLIYSATLASSRSRGRVFMGHDAHMEVGGSLNVFADRDSTRYRDKIQEGVINPSLPLVTYRPGSKGIDAVTSATEQYYAARGLIYTYRDGRRVDVSHLHLKEWLDSIRQGTPVSCPIDKGMEVAIACHMATRSYREKRRVHWDPVKRRIV
ncbi:Gfo/Idh/MocA family protein [bacterium]